MVSIPGSENIPVATSGKSDAQLRPSTAASGAIAIVTTVRWDAMDARLRLTSAALRTVKSFGSDAPVLASSSKSANAARERWWQESRSPGRSRISRKAIAWGGRWLTAEPVCSWAAYLFATGLRDRGCSAHPVFPAPSFLREGRRHAKLRAEHAARTRPHIQSSSRP